MSRSSFASRGSGRCFTNARCVCIRWVAKCWGRPRSGPPLRQIGWGAPNQVRPTLTLMTFRSGSREAETSTVFWIDPSSRDRMCNPFSEYPFDLAQRLIRTNHLNLLCFKERLTLGVVELMLDCGAGNPSLPLGALIPLGSSDAADVITVGGSFFCKNFSHKFQPSSNPR